MQKLKSIWDYNLQIILFRISQEIQYFRYDDWTHGEVCEQFRETCRWKNEAIKWGEEENRLVKESVLSLSFAQLQKVFLIFNQINQLNTKYKLDYARVRACTSYSQNLRQHRVNDWLFFPHVLETSDSSLCIFKVNLSFELNFP